MKPEKVKCEECGGTGWEEVGFGLVPCEICGGEGEYEQVYCHPCSVAGGADRAIYHEPPACPEEPKP